MYKISQNSFANFPAASFCIWPSFSYAAEQSAGCSTGFRPLDNRAQSQGVYQSDFQKLSRGRNVFGNILLNSVEYPNYCITENGQNDEKKSRGNGAIDERKGEKES